ncbi:MAG: hypothetical protein VR72_02170 [Clostridiaceae bacterium BRH_c20a]|nr:MAG: hypothetical protein VR72_02170 [Clostridiaceae bacterium BRH_c20a]
MKLNINQDLCSGCRLCENTCAFYHKGLTSPNYSRITICHIGKWALPNITVCLHCKEPECVDACPTGAMYKDLNTETILVKEDLCIGCGLCVDACKFEAVIIHPETQVAFKCDTCNGNFSCSQKCDAKAIYLV